MNKPKKDGDMDFSKTGKVKTKLCSVKELWAMKSTVIRSAVIGTVVGILPGAGCNDCIIFELCRRCSVFQTSGNLR
ncbi:MAG: hypothetical protein ACLUD2_06300 [Clostridium sp.]